MSVGGFSNAISAVDPGMNQLVELPFEQSNAYIMQDGSVLSATQIPPGGQAGKSLLKPELAQHLGQHGYKTTVGRGGFTMGTADSRWVSATSPRSNRTITRKPLNLGFQGPASVPGASLMQTSGVLSLGSRYTPSSASAFGIGTTPFSGGALVTPSSGATILPANVGMDRDQNYRLSAAMAGTNSRGRPRGRRPLRGQFPVVPIDMVRQLGIEQQVILQPAAPVAMRNKAVLCRPLSMCRKTQVSSVQFDSAQSSSQSVPVEEFDEPLKKSSQKKDHRASQVDVGISTVAQDDTQAVIERELVETGMCTDTMPIGVEQCSQTDLDDSMERTVSRPQYIPVPVPVPIFVPTPIYLYARPVPYTLPFPLPCPIPFPVLPKDMSIFSKQGDDPELNITDGNIEFGSSVPKRSGYLVETDETDETDVQLSAPSVEPQSSDEVQQEEPIVSSVPIDAVDEDADGVHQRSHKRPASPLVSSSDSVTDEPSSEATLVNDAAAPKNHLAATALTPSGAASVTRTGEPPSKRPRHAMVVSDANYHLKFSYGINAWRHWVQHKLSTLGNLVDEECPYLRIELLNMSETDLNLALSQFVREVRKPNGECYVADSIFYLCLGIQEFLNENGRFINVFGGPVFVDLIKALDDILANFQPRISPEGLLVCRIEEEHLWEAQQLGYHSSDVLLFTILYFNTKHLGLRDGALHRRLAFWQYQFIDEPVKGTAMLCHLPSSLYGSAEEDSSATVRFDANTTHPERCPVKLFRTYCSRCPTSALSSEDAFYLTPTYPANDGGPYWYSTVPVDSPDLQVMLNRIKMVKEIQEAFMNGQPDCGF